MTRHSPPLLIIGAFTETFNFLDLLQTDTIQSHILLTKGKYADLDKAEIVFDGMAFELEFFNQTETDRLLQENTLSTLFSSPAAPNSMSIGIGLSEHIENGKHLPSINQALLKVAQLLGKQSSASHIGWLPARQSIDFGHFSEAVDDYLSGGPTPVLIQIAITKDEENILQTQGLSYFANQEVTLTTPFGMSDSEAIKRLVRISHDIAVNGKIESKLETKGLAEDELLSFIPSADKSKLAVTINTKSG
ncbi:MAG: hypothetical protein Pars2KO_22570 [Parasphingorhabdus sp.]